MEMIKSYKHGKNTYYHLESVCVLSQEVFREIEKLSAEYIVDKYIDGACPGVDFHTTGDDYFLTIPLLCFILRNEILEEEAINDSEYNQTLNKLYILNEDLIEFLIPKPD